MPELVSKILAIERLKQEGEAGKCLMCKLNQNNDFVIFEDEHTTVFLSAYPRFWGHTIVSLKRHVECFSDLNEEEYRFLFENSRKVAIAIEKALKPLRTYIASVGATENKLNTCPHIHVNVLPIYENDIKPSQVFTWENGIYKGTEVEWGHLKTVLKSAMNA